MKNDKNNEVLSHLQRENKPNFLKMRKWGTKAKCKLPNSIENEANAAVQISEPVHNDFLKLLMLL